MKKKKRIITIAGLLLVAIVGATFAYYTSNTSFENVFNAGKYKVTLTEVFESPDNWVPGETIPKTVTAKNDGTVPAAVRISYTEQWLKEIDGVETDITSQVTPNPAIINFANQTDWTSSDGYYYYKYILEPTDETSSFISGVTLDPNLNSVTCTGEGNEKTCEAQNPASGAKYKLTFTIQTVQYDQYQSIWNTNVEITEKRSGITYLTRQVEGQITPGDIIGIGETEDFYVISTSEEKTVLLAKYNLLVGRYYDEEEATDVLPIPSDTPGYGLQDADAIGYGAPDSYHGGRGTVPFSSTNYWDDNGLKPSYAKDLNNNNASYSGNPYPYVYDNSHTTEPDFSDDCDDSTNCYNTPGYGIAYYVEQYKTRLIGMGAPSTITGRLLSIEEAYAARTIGDNGISIILNGRSSWLGSAVNAYYIWPVYSDPTTIEDASLYSAPEHLGNDDFAYLDAIEFGLRPVIEIPTSELQ